MHCVYLGLGANLNSPKKQLDNAIAALKKLPDCEFISVSHYYASKPMGPQDQPDYINAVACINTTLSPEKLLDLTQAIELEHGRVRKAERWGPRTLDIDMLLFDAQTINTERLIVPHYGLTEREFVVYPLLELAPKLILPSGIALHTIANTLPLNNLQQLPQ
ncbi:MULTISPECIES: 2-amino-4-hydroxy-6-hydroxymethyldihydropteridine diphosphokinase [Pseudoalteromonas]|mgnify:FL=1|uniref:2-amino-4-hydroxy-6-hydroxymethyldihydropteridine pyrophosphokinase n=2 Tax=Pseudoalteromonas TaxID=53246 RepID=Q3ILK9_PSET1|nr:MULTISPECIES: 2-amino-4-hydroxy-6-hydroxymethyldihydropteridine diphosphokinase [Pseudoalteromonas]ASM53001.1 2-amino-4-hydroxy-6-hydroxymethyldihydropteridine diphosphokinase [Pseudoalteromonas nigrifaciens]MBE0420257.1 2-amino-4-hydroxy-6-hydroxymethyldihydropteridine diphosphokinase [Pseudoalteromonas nigrifaciens]MBH0071780.1 2-amino-4-hydroxy-6-hydroxymethyldihydropteridine diphosphokinase [Pseudoalteromonas sp. NZS127]MBO7926591.1 2-amino-4-hydroxy-6-hydroxymethyldihydropteridine dipho|tara:strand:- start:36990 stop:37475 length:486 start_codon:yes stop_codon:yes gene_type:complete